MSSDSHETPSKICDEVAERLLGGGSLEGDARLAAHAGSCLACFRVVSDLRDLPRIEGLLWQAQSAANPDPGDAFWASFPQAVTAAFVSRQSADERAQEAPPHFSGARAPLRIPATPPPRRRFADWIRLPMPAALAGAAISGLLVFALAGPQGARVLTVNQEIARESIEPGRRAMVPVQSSAPATRSRVAAPVSGTVSDEEGEGDLEQSLASLKVSELETLVMEIAADVPTAGMVGTEEGDLELAEGVAEEMEDLGAAELKDLVTALRRQSQI
jgi:hypothetical protein